MDIQGINQLQLAADPMGALVDLKKATMAKDLDRALSAALDQRLGAGNWSIETLQGRLGVQPQGFVTTYYLDGAPLLRTRVQVVDDLYGRDTWETTVSAFK